MKNVTLNTDEALRDLHEMVQDLRGKVEAQEQLIRQLLQLLNEKQTLDDDEYPNLLQLLR